MPSVYSVLWVSVMPGYPEGGAESLQSQIDALKERVSELEKPAREADELYAKLLRQRQRVWDHCMENPELRKDAGLKDSDE